MNTLPYNIVQALGLILSNTSVYGIEHAVTRQAEQSCFQTLQRAWASEDVAINLTESGLAVNHVPVESKNPLVKHCGDHFEKRNITNILLRKGMTEEQFIGFIEVLNAKPEELEQLGGFAEAISAVGLSDVVVTRKVSYREVSDDEVVLSKETVENADAAGTAGGGKDSSGQTGSPENSAAAKDSGSMPEPAAPAVDGLPAAGHNADETVAEFLYSDDMVPNETVARLVRDLTGDADRMAKIVLQAAHDLHSPTPDTHADAEQLGEQIAAGLRRIYQAITMDPSFHTQKNKRQWQQALAKIKQAVQDRVSAEDCPDANQVDSIVNDTVETMNDELIMDTLAQEYTKRRKAIRASEKRLKRFLESKASGSAEVNNLKTRLLDGGLDEQEWKTLLVKGEDDAGMTPEGGDSASSAGDGDGGNLGSLSGGSPEGSGAQGELAVLLDKIEAGARMEGNFSPDPVATDSPASASLPSAETAEPSPIEDRAPAHVLIQDLQHLQQQVDQIVRRTEQRIESLVAEVGGKPVTPRERTSKPQLSRKRLFEILAEIAQELCQPLAVINCSVDLVRGGSLGDVAEAQKQILDTAAGSGEKLKLLIDKLIAIAGTPKGLKVDQAIQQSLCR